MKSILLKVNDKIKTELDLIRAEEGLGTQTATVTYLIKYYLLTKKPFLNPAVYISDQPGLPKTSSFKQDYYKTIEPTLDFWHSDDDDNIFS